MTWTLEMVTDIKILPQPLVAGPSVVQYQQIKCGGGLWAGWLDHDGTTLEFRKLSVQFITAGACL